MRQLSSLNKHSSCRRVANPVPEFDVLALEQRAFLSAPAIDVPIISPPSVATLPAAFTISVQATDPDGIRGVTFFRDHDRNGVWTPGVDQDLAFITTGTNNTFAYAPTSNQQAGWPEYSQLGVNAVDNLGNWGVPRVANLTTTRNASVSISTIEGAFAAPGQPFEVRINTRGAVRAATAWVDDANDGIFDARYDIPIGDSFTPLPGSAGAFVIKSSASLDWPIAFDTDRNDFRVAIWTNAMSPDGTWGTPVKSTLGLYLDGLPEIQEFVTYWAPGQNRIRFDGWAEDFLLKPNAVQGNVSVITFFFDANKNNRWDGPNIDTDIGFAAENLGFSLTFPADPNWPADAQFVATARDNRVNGDGWGQPRSAIPVAGEGSVADAEFLFTTVAPAPGGNSSLGVGQGDRFSLNSNVSRANTSLPVTAIFFHDRNSNGLWEPTIDLELHRETKIASSSGFAQFTTPLFDNDFSRFAPGLRRFGVVFESQGRDRASFSYGTVQRFMEKPAIGNFSVPSITVPRGTPFSFDFTAYGSAMVANVEARLMNSVQGWPFGVAPSSLQRLNGLSTPNAVRWRITFNTTGLAAGNYNVFLDGVNVEGLWSPRRFNLPVTIT